MLPKASLFKKSPLLLFGFVLVGLSFAIVISLIFDLSGSPDNGSLASIQGVTSVVEQVRSGLPVRLKIPSINVDAAIESVGITPLGAMDVPKGPAEAAWFNLGPRPGEEGSAVVAGHFGWKDGIPAVFDRLHELRVGEKIYVTDDRGVSVAFTVRELRTYGEKDDASGVFSANDGASHLNLITCEGVWNKQAKSYSNRLVVFADKE